MHRAQPGITNLLKCSSKTLRSQGDALGLTGQPGRGSIVAMDGMILDQQINHLSHMFLQLLQRFYIIDLLTNALKVVHSRVVRAVSFVSNLHTLSPHCLLINS